MRIRSLPLVAAALLLVAACSDRPSSVDLPEDASIDLAQPDLAVLDGTSPDGNQHFFWLRPIGEKQKNFPGVADGTLFPTVEICLRNAAGDGCALNSVVATFSRNANATDDDDDDDDGDDDDDESGKHAIKVDDDNEYKVNWHLKDFPPQRDGVYRIRVLLQGTEVGYADVIVLSKKDEKAYVKQGGELIPVVERGTFKIAFRMEEGVLEQTFCDLNPGAQDCQAAQEIAGDGQSTTVQVDGTTTTGETVAAVITVPDAVFTDVNGDPIPNVVITAQVTLDPPSADVFPDAQEFPFFVQVNTYPENVYIDPNGPGVSVVVCQDEAELDARGVVAALHPQLILYKVSDTGLTQRLVSTFGAPECGGAAAAPAQAAGLLGLLKRGTSRVLDFIGPEPLVARRRIHGGLNTIITRDASMDAAFSTFGAALGPNAGATTAILPANGVQDSPTPITIQVRDALGVDFPMSGDTLEITVRGANPTPAFRATDVGLGLHTASYTPTAPGVDSIDIVLIRYDGVGLGPIGGSPYVITVFAPTQVVNTGDSGLGSLRQAILNANAQPGADVIDFAIPGPGPHVINLSTALPDITDPVTIDGTTQAGYAGAPVVGVDGAVVAPGVDSGYGFYVKASNTTIRGLAITRHPRAGVFAFQGISGVVVQDNTIGTDAAGASGLGNAEGGVRLRAAGSSIQDNVISGNTQNGILLELASATGNTITGNTIGMAPNGTDVLPNTWSGITMYDGVANTVVQGNLISGNDQHGIDIQHSGLLAPVTGTQILGNVVGLDPAGAVIRRGPSDVIDDSSVNWGPYERGNLGSGVRLTNAPNTAVGGGNVLSGNRGHGVEIIGPATGVTVKGNLIGLDPTGTLERGNGTFGADGISVYGAPSSGAVIGGTTPADRNVVSGNLSDGIGIDAGNVTVMGNYIGTDLTGTVAIGNGTVFTTPDVQSCCHSGLFVLNATGVVIGGVAPGAGNLISGNNTGLWIGSAPGIQILGNKIGTNAAGNAFVPNSGDGGIALYGTVNAVVQGNEISGNTAIAGVFAAFGTQGSLIQANTFEGNGGAAVILHPTTGSGNTIRSNSMDGNGFGIDLGWDGPTPNDLLDADSGPNDLVNHPDLVGALNGVIPGSTQVNGTLNAEPFTIYEVELFSSPTCHPSGWGEGRTPLAVLALPPTGPAGELPFSLSVPAQAVGSVITATATDGFGNTSEFSECVTVDPAPSFSLSAAIPGQAAAGFGQMITLDGSGFPTSPTVNFTQGPTTLSGFVYSATPTQIVVRLPTSGLASSPLGVPTGVAVTDGVGVSNTLTIPVSTTPGTPQIVQIWEADWTPLAPPPSNVCGGPASPSDGFFVLNSSAALIVQAHGLDTSGAQIQILQGGNTWTLNPSCAFFAPSAHIVPLPNFGTPGDLGGTLVNAPAQVRVRTQVNGVWSDWSVPVGITLVLGA